MDPNGLLMDVNGMAHQCLSLGLPHQDGLFAGVQGPIRRTEVATSPVSPEGVAGGVHISEKNAVPMLQNILQQLKRNYLIAKILTT